MTKGEEQRIRTVRAALRRLGEARAKVAEQEAEVARLRSAIKTWCAEERERLGIEVPDAQR